MEKIDRLGWAGGVCFRSFGMRLGIRTNTPEVPADLLAYLPPVREPSTPPFVDLLWSLRVGGDGPRPGVRLFHQLRVGSGLIIKTFDWQELLERVENSVQMNVAEYNQTRVFVHAGVVGWKGRAILVPGRSFAGKTTL